MGVRNTVSDLDEQAITIDRAAVQFGELYALDGVSLSVDVGERVALVGPSGAGKSTLLGLITTALAPTAGTVEVLGCAPQQLSARDLRRLRRRIGTVYQGLHLPGSLRVVHNVAAGRLGAWSTGTALRSLVRPVERDDVADALGQLGIADKLWSRTDQLSGGEQQRVAIARVLVQHPEIVVADEPVASLDPARSREVIELLLSSVGRGDGQPTVVVSLHSVDLAVEYFDRVVGLRQGVVVFDQPAHRLLDAAGAEQLRRLYELAALDS